MEGRNDGAGEVEAGEEVGMVEGRRDSATDDTNDFIYDIENNANRSNRSTGANQIRLPSEITLQ